MRPHEQNRAGHTAYNSQSQQFSKQSFVALRISVAKLAFGEKLQCLFAQYRSRARGKGRQEEKKELTHDFR